jgi:hypothetical protein
MPIKLVYILIILLLITACPSSRNPSVPNVAAITYRETSGPISADTAWDELYTVSTTDLTFVRTGYSALTTINTGTWTINTYGPNEAKLFSDLSSIDVYNVKKTGQDSLPVGAGIKDYTIRYTNGEIREVIVGDGSTYNNVELITTPINNYIADINLPVDASQRYRSLQMGGAIQGNPLTLSSIVTTLAGTANNWGSTDGIGIAARFFIPHGITTDGDNLYIADSNNGTIRKIIISTGVVSTLTGSAGVYGYTDGTGTDALFGQTLGITTDGTNLYVSDSSNNTIRKIVISSGVVKTLAGTAGINGATDGTAAAARFDGPYGITTDGTNLYVVDTYNMAIRKVIISSGAVTTLAGSQFIGSADGTGAAASFSYPAGITTDGTNLYVADSGNSTIRKITISSGVVSTLAGTAGVFGSTDSTGSAASFFNPSGITTDGTNLYVADSGNHAIRKIVISTAVVTTLAGTAGVLASNDGTAGAASFNFPRGITTDGTNLYVADTSNSTIRKIQ